MNGFLKQHVRKYAHIFFRNTYARGKQIMFVRISTDAISTDMLDHAFDDIMKFGNAEF